MAALPPVGNVPRRQDIQIYQGADFVYPFTITDEDDDALDITGYTIAASLRRHRLGPLVVSFTITIENALVGNGYASLSAAQTALLKCGELPTSPASLYWWDIRAQSPSPTVLAAYARHGEASVWANVTRDP